MTRFCLLEPAAYVLLGLVAPISLVLFAAPLLAAGCIDASSLAVLPDWAGVARFVLKLVALR